MRKDQLHDYYFLKAKKENFSARSVYKLQDIQSKYKLLKRGDNVLDLGCSPGSWCEYLADLLGPNGSLLGIDIQPMAPQALERIKRSKTPFQFIQASILEHSFDGQKFSVIVSDMAPSTQGNRLVDTQRSLELIEAAFSVAKQVLIPGGHFVVKLFQSNDTVMATKAWAQHFAKSKLYRPPAVRKESKEVYFVGMGFSVR